MLRRNPQKDSRIGYFDWGRCCVQSFSFKVCFVLSIKNAGVVLASGVVSFCRFSVRCRFSVSEVCLNFRKRVGPLRNGKEPILVTIFLPKLISDQQWDLLSPILEKQCLCFGPVFKGRHGINRKIRNGKGHVKIFPAGGDPMVSPSKISFHGGIQKEKGVPCQVQNSAHAWRELPWGYTQPKRFWPACHWVEWNSTGESSSCTIWAFCPDLSLWKISAEPLFSWERG